VQSILISFEQILILFIYIVVGFILKRTKLINIEGDKTLSNLTNYLYSCWIYFKKNKTHKYRGR